MKNFMIRPGMISDCYKVYLLICELEARELSYDNFKNIYSKMLEKDYYLIFVVVKDEQIVGEITLRFEDQLHHCSKIAEIIELVVKSECRSCGLGSLLFNKACAVAKEKNCNQIEVSSNCMRISAHKFYERLGMKKSHYKFCKSLL